MFVDRRWEEQEISRFASLLKLGTQLGDDLLRGESLDGLGCGHGPLSEPSSGIATKVDGSRTDVPGTGCYNLEIGGNTPEAEHIISWNQNPQRPLSSLSVYGFELSLLLFVRIVTGRR